MNHNDKLLYLKALCTTKGEKKVIKEITEAIKDINDKGIFKFSHTKEKKPKNPLDDVIEGRKFILNNTEEFLNHCVDYSMADKIEDLLFPQK